MSYTNYINKLSYDTKKVLEESSSIHNEILDLKKKNFSLKYLNDNSIGYKIKYIFEIDKEIQNINNSIALEIILYYLIETELFQNNIHLEYVIYFSKNNLYFSLFHTNREYLNNIFPKIIQNIYQSIQELSENIRNKLSNYLTLPIAFKIKILKKEYPIIINIICNILGKKVLTDKSEEIINTIIKIIQFNEIQIKQISDIYLSTYKSIDDPIDYLISKKNYNNNNNNNVLDNKSDVLSDDESDDDSDKSIKNIEFINDNIKQLFWHTNENNDPLKNNGKKKKWIHSILFTFIFAIIVYLLPKYINKISDFSKNNVVIDNILDLATEDLTQTIIQKNAPILKKKLDTIIEQPNEPNEPNEPDEPSEPSDQPDELKIIANNILKRYSDSSHQNKNIELKNIKERLKLILEETSTN
jgi:hypothetical protein